MPTINRKKIKPKAVPYKHDKNISAEFYGSVQWKNLRNRFIKEHPLCEHCLEKGIVKPTEEVHHKIEFLKGKDEQEKWNLLLDEDNLLSVCRDCHMELHNYWRRTATDDE